MSSRVVGGLMMRVGGRSFPTSVRLEDAPAPACWRCGRQLFLNQYELVPGGDEAHPFVWVCEGCVSDEDREAIANS